MTNTSPPSSSGLTRGSTELSGVDAKTWHRLSSERNLYEGKYRSIVALMDRARQELQEIFDHIDDEGDRAYFGSTNHPDQLRDLLDHMKGWAIDALLPKGDINKMERDPYAEIRAQRQRADTAQAALKTAISHIEHMAAFITSLEAGYSFESLGEDMPGMKAAADPRVKPEDDGGEETPQVAQLTPLERELLDALKLFKTTIIGEIHDKWDEGMRAGKLIVALANPSLKYRADISSIHAAIAKAESMANPSPEAAP